MSINLNLIDPSLKAMYALNKDLNTLIDCLQAHAKDPNIESAISAGELNTIIEDVTSIFYRQMDLNKTILDKIYKLEDKKKPWFHFFKWWL